MFFLRQVVRCGKIPFEISAKQDDFYNPTNLGVLRKAIDGLEKGLGTVHELIEVDE